MEDIRITNMECHKKLLNFDGTQDVYEIYKKFAVKAKDLILNYDGAIAEDGMYYIGVYRRDYLHHDKYGGIIPVYYDGDHVYLPIKLTKENVRLPYEIIGSQHNLLNYNYSFITMKAWESVTVKIVNEFDNWKKPIETAKRRFSSLVKLESGVKFIKIEGGR